MGLLDNKDALVQGLLAFGGNTLANNTGHYGAFGPAVGRGIQGFGQSYFGAIQQQKENEERAKRMALLEKMQGAQIGEMEQRAKQAQYERERQAQMDAVRARLLGGFGQTPGPQPMPQGLGGMPSGGTPPFMPQGSVGGTMLPPAAAAAEGDLLASQVRQPAQNVPMETPPVEVTSKPLSFLQNEDQLRALSSQLANAGLHKDAEYYLTLADKVQAQKAAEQADEGKIQNDAQGVPRYLRTGQPVFTGDQRKAPEGMQYGENGLEPIPGFLDMKKQIAAAGKPDINVAVNSKEQTEEAKAVGKFQGEQYADIQKAGFNAQAKIERFNRLEQLLDGVATGKLTPVGTDIAAYAKSVGINIDDKLPNKEAAASLINAMALELRNPSGGAGMPGAMSDADREYLRTMVPSLANTPDGRKQLIETGRKMAQREKDVARLAREYRKKNGGMDEGFYDELEAFSAKNPMFSKSDKPIKKYNPATGKIE